MAKKCGPISVSLLIVTLGCQFAVQPSAQAAAQSQGAGTNSKKDIFGHGVTADQVRMVKAFEATVRTSFRKSQRGSAKLKAVFDSRNDLASWRLSSQLRAEWADEEERIRSAPVPKGMEEVREAFVKAMEGNQIFLDGFRDGLKAMNATVDVQDKAIEKQEMANTMTARALAAGTLGLLAEESRLGLVSPVPYRGMKPLDAAEKWWADGQRKLSR